jgi:peroxiredoxin
VNRVKSIFVSLFIAFSVVVFLHGVVALLREPRWSWVPATVAGLAAAGFFAFLYLLRRARTSRNLWWQTVLFAALALAALAFHLQGGERLPVAYALAVLIGWILYVFGYSRFPQRDAEQLQVGHALPVFTLQDDQGRSVSSRSLLGYAAVLIFYRGNWCPFCRAQIQELAEQYRQIEAAGARVVLISSQSQAHTQALARKLGVPFRFWVDTGNNVARQLGIAADAGTPLGLQVLGYEADTVLPTVIVINAEGAILFADLTDNYRLRPEPATFLRVLRG